MIPVVNIKKDFQKSTFFEKLRSLEMREEIPLKKDINRWEKGALIVRIIVKEENSKKFLIVYFHLRFSVT